MSTGKEAQMQVSTDGGKTYHTVKPLDLSDAAFSNEPPDDGTRVCARCMRLVRRPDGTRLPCLCTDLRFTEAWRKALPIFLERYADPDLASVIRVDAPDEFLLRMFKAIDMNVPPGTSPDSLALHLQLLFNAPMPPRGA